MPRSSKQSEPTLMWVNGDQTSDGVIVDTDGTEALIELPDGALAVRLVKDLQPVQPEPATATKVVVTAAAPDAPVRARRVPTTDEVLHCQAGHTWTRKSQRGRKPLFCPEHQLDQADHPVQTLHCKHGDGHEWTRPSQRGAKPEYCPEHRPTPAKPVRTSTEAPSTPRAPAVPVINDDGVETEAPIKVVQPKQSVDQILTQFHPDPETARKLQYIDSELRRGRESGDVKMLLETQASILRRLNMKVRVAA